MASPRFGRVTGTRNGMSPRVAPPESTTSAFSTTTSFDSRSEEGPPRERTRSNATDREVTRDTTYSSRDATRDTSYFSQRDVTASSKRDVTFLSASGGGGDTSTTTVDTERHQSYDLQHHYDEGDYKMEWSCGAAGGCQRLSFVLLVTAFLGHGIAVCTPYWVVGYEGGVMTVYEGVWLSCYRDLRSGSWVCSTFDTIRHLFEQPTWYEASQVSAVLSVVLMMPALLVATLYSFSVNITGQGRTHASWLLVVFTLSAAMHSEGHQGMHYSEFSCFLSVVIFAAGYPWDQTFPHGHVSLNVSFALQIISCLLCLLSLAAHLRDWRPDLSVWNNKLCATDGLPPVPEACGIASCASGKMNVVSLSKSSQQPVPKPMSTKATKLGGFSLPKFPSALSRFRPTSRPTKGEVEDIVRRSNNRPSTLEEEQQSEEEGEVAREATAASQKRPPTLPTSLEAPHAAQMVGQPVTNKSFVASSGGDSLSGYDSQV